MPAPLVLLLLSVVLEAAPDSELVVRKCCGQHQLLDSSHACRDLELEAGDGDDPWWWLPRSSVWLDNSPTDTEVATRALSSVRAEYNAMAPCGQQSRLELVRLPGEDVNEFRLHIGAEQDGEASRSYFLLRNRKPNCSAGWRLLQGNASDFRLREDGYLLVPGGAWLPPEDFCGDHVLANSSVAVVITCLRPASGP